ncbi:MAG: hypothetical protein F4X35_12820 [Alphaproteobacteria bacterium]|nr:hypothetical protein [Alphaproteobacteria bacterium]
MTRINTLKTSFSAGELSPRLAGRPDLAAYRDGARRLRNVTVHPTGGLSRRPGLAFVEAAPGPGRLAAFEFNTEESYLLLFTDRRSGSTGTASGRRSSPRPGGRRTWPGSTGRRPPTRCWSSIPTTRRRP